jgi:zona occludens toxin (predicted ATPase)
MIVLYSGIPGSGKSYKMVHDLEAEKKKYFVIHNIDGLKEGYLGEGEGFSFIKYCEDQKMEVEEFFSKDYQIEITEAVRAKYNKNCLIIIDECHEWFDKNKKSLKMWLSYHRHLNELVWLVAHRSSNLPSVYRSFIEVEYRAKFSSIFALPGFFIYNRILGGEAVGYTYAKKKQQVFALYKSMAEGFKKPKPSLVIPIAALLIILGVWYFLAMPGKLKKTPPASAGTIYEKSDPAPGAAVLSLKSGLYSYAGKIGSEYLVQDVDSGRISKIIDLPENVIFFSASDSELTLFNTDTKSKIILKKYVKTKAVADSGFISSAAKPLKQ